MARHGGTVYWIRQRLACTPHLDRAIGLTLAQRARRAALWLVLGASIAAAVLAWHERRFAEPARLAPPVLEHSGARLDVYRFDLEWRFARFSCRLIVHRDTQTWSVTC